MLETAILELAAEMRQLSGAMHAFVAAAAAKGENASDAQLPAPPVKAAKASEPAKALKATPPAAEAATAAKAADYEACKEALKAVSAKFGPTDGRQKAIDILSRYGVQKLPELPPNRFEEFVAHCQNVLAGGEP